MTTISTLFSKALLVAAVLLLSSGRAHAQSFVLSVNAEQARVVPSLALRAVAELRDGRERLWLQLKLASHGSGAGGKLLWITALPADASAVSAQAVGGVPAFSGVSQAQHAALAVRRTLATMALSQLWTAPLVYGAVHTASPLVPPERLLSTPSQAYEAASLEVVAGDASTLLEARLKALGATAPRDLLHALAPSARASRSFVIYAIEPERAQADGGVQLTMLLRFPSQEGVIPLPSGAVAAPNFAVDVSVFDTADALGTSSGWKVTPMVGSHAVPVLQTPSPTARAAEPYTTFTWQGDAASVPAALRFGPAAQGAKRAWSTYDMARPVTFALSISCLALFGALAGLLARRVWPVDTRPTPGAAAGMGALHAATVVAPLVLALVRARRVRAPTSSALKFVALSSVVLVALLFSMLFVCALIGA